MATYTGKNARAGIGPDPTIIGKVKEVQLNGTVETQEDEYIGEPGKDVSAGNEAWTSSITFHEDPDDAGQQLLILGATVDMTVYPRGNTVGLPRRTYQAIVTADPMTLNPSSKVEKTVPLAVIGVPVDDVVPV